jgi:hypothetical protein
MVTMCVYAKIMFCYDKTPVAGIAAYARGCVLCVHDSVGTLPYLQVHCTAAAAAATAAAVLTAYTNMIQRCNSTHTPSVGHSNHCVTISGSVQFQCVCVCVCLPVIVYSTKDIERQLHVCYSYASTSISPQVCVCLDCNYLNSTTTSS